MCSASKLHVLPAIALFLWVAFVVTSNTTSPWAHMLKEVSAAGLIMKSTRQSEITKAHPKLFVTSALVQPSTQALPSILQSTSPRRQRLGLLTAYYGERGLALKAGTWANKRAYAAAHGLHIEDAGENEAMLDLQSIAANTPGDSKQIQQQQLQFLKLRILKHYIAVWHGRFDYIFFSDADSVFLNFSKNILDACPVAGMDHGIEVLLPAGPPPNATAGISPNWGKVPNTGHFFISVSAFSSRLIQAVLEHRLYSQIHILYLHCLHLLLL